jgi:predicted dehydrogenase
MAKRRLLGALGFGTGVLAGSVLYRRSSGRRHDRIEVYFDDGSMVSFVDGSPEADRLLPIARDVLAAARR